MGQGRKCMLDLADPDSDAAVAAPEGHRQTAATHDGRSGEQFERRTTVGIMHFLKLNRGRRQDPCPLHRPVLAGDPAAAGW